MPHYNTNLAAEFYVLSALHRLGIDADLTLGNKKAVDIVVVHDAGNAITIDVKGLAGRTSWPVDNIKAGREGHFIVFICFMDEISDLSKTPEAYIVPSLDLDALDLIYNAPSGRRVVQLSRLKKYAEKYHNAWDLLKPGKSKPKRLRL